MNVQRKSARDIPAYVADVLAVLTHKNLKDVLDAFFRHRVAMMRGITLRRIRSRRPTATAISGPKTWQLAKSPELGSPWKTYIMALGAYTFIPGAIRWI